MSRLPPDVVEDRKLRDAARRHLSADLAQLKASLAEQGVASRLVDTVTGPVRRRVVTGARDVAAAVRDQAKARPALLTALGAALLGGLALWLLRRPGRLTPPPADATTGDWPAPSPPPQPPPAAPAPSPGSDGGNP